MCDKGEQGLPGVVNTGWRQCMLIKAFMQDIQKASVQKWQSHLDGTWTYFAGNNLFYVLDAKESTIKRVWARDAHRAILFAQKKITESEAMGIDMQRIYEETLAKERENHLNTAKRYETLIQAVETMPEETMSEIMHRWKTMCEGEGYWGCGV